MVFSEKYILNPSVLIFSGIGHSCLPDDRHNVANHFCPQAFLSGKSFPSWSMFCSSAFILLFILRQYSCQLEQSNFTWAVDIVQSYTQPPRSHSSRVFFASGFVFSKTLISFLSRDLIGIQSQEVFNFKKYYGQL